MKLEFINKSRSNELFKQVFSDLFEASANIDTIAKRLNDLSSEDRIFAARGLNGRAQKRLWELSENRLVTAELIVPETKQNNVVRHFGRNSLPVFKFFEKRFQRLASEKDSELRLSGFNYQPLMGLTGPGYFIAHHDEEFGSLAIDYREVPTEPLPDAPPVKPNDRGISRLVYKNMIDRMRKVSEHVTIGRVFRNGKWENNYFVLCREGDEQ